MLRTIMRLPLLGVVFLTSGYGADDDAAFYTTSVQPILTDHCIRCHGAERQKGHLRLDSREAVLAGGKGGPAIVVGKPDESLLIKAVRYTDDDLQMPPKKQLADDQIKILVDWVTRGAPWAAPAATVPASQPPATPTQP